MVNPIYELHQELTQELEPLLTLISDPKFEELPDYMTEKVFKERDRLEMLLEVLEEDDEFDIEYSRKVNSYTNDNHSSYEMERIRALRNHPDYDYYGNYIGEERTDIKIVKKQNTKKIKTTLKEAA